MVVQIKPDPEVVCASDVTSAGNTRLVYWMYRLTLPASSETKSRMKSGIQSQCLCNTFKANTSLCLLTETLGTHSRGEVVFVYNIHTHTQEE